ncbi:hypothetical protein CAL26_27200 [Bordetella genomosp. 9]|uniref:HTH lysR-type domain-containing protein n=2 Tax=Bordetella genomosp. 9 TaxID=1416803 RepID=A0A261R8X3_9BORD|nr:hypothetical protein CAL26_27200 [Bordetella genomosp. 9]
MILRDTCGVSPQRRAGRHALQPWKGDRNAMSTRASSLDLRMVQQFLAVAETLSFRKAAEQMHMAQPPLSQAIMRLESLVQARLFERSPRGVRLTPAGEVFKLEAARLLNQADRALERTRRAGRGELGTVHVGFIGPAMIALLPKVIRAFRERYAGVELALHEGSSMQVAGMIHSDTVDIGFLVTPAELEPDVMTEVIAVDTLMAMLPAGHRLGGAASIRLEDLADDAFVMFSAQGVPTLSSRIAVLCRQSGFEPRIVQEAVQISTVLGLVAGGLGVAILPGSIGGLAATGAVVCKPLVADAASLRVQICAAYRAERLSEAARTFLVTARACAGSA